MALNPSGRRDLAKVTGLGHLGIYVQDMPKMLDFYTNVLGLTITDRADGDRAVFLSARPGHEHHEFVMGVATDRHTNAQQISFTVGSLDDLRTLFHAICEHPECGDVHVTNHGIAIGCYFSDPENNRVEVYWSTGMDYVQPAVGRIDLDLPNEQILRLLDEMPPMESVTPWH